MILKTIEDVQDISTVLIVLFSEMKNFVMKNSGLCSGNDCSPNTPEQSETEQENVGPYGFVNNGMLPPPFGSMIPVPGSDRA